MYKIYIDTTKRYEKAVSLRKDGTETDLIKGDIDIVSSIQEILEKNGLKLGNIEEIIPNTGPGSFTGIKIGITIANVLNWVCGKKTQKELAKPSYGKGPNIQKS